MESPFRQTLSNSNEILLSKAVSDGANIETIEQEIITYVHRRAALITKLFVFFWRNFVL